MPSDVTGDEIGAPERPKLCGHCAFCIASAARHGHVDQEWADRAAVDLSRQCCTNGRPKT